jgi:hypothetical protein
MGRKIDVRTIIGSKRLLEMQGQECYSGSIQNHGNRVLQFMVDTEPRGITLCILGVPRANKRYFDSLYIFLLNIHFSSIFLYLSCYENSFEMNKLSKRFS